MKKAEELSKKLCYQRKNFWREASVNEKKLTFKFSEGYKAFLDKCKTEREAIEFYADILENKGFAEIDKAGKSAKVYRLARKKNAAIAVLGKKTVSEGVNIIVSHIDAPRVDLKQNPLFEDGDTKLGMMRTHYYGGVKKYQWMSTPLALHGVFVKENGEIVKVSIGEDEKDPVFVMPDLLPHLARKEQYSKKLGEAVSAGKMNLIFNSIPYLEDKDAKEAVKLNALILLNEKYNIIEEHFLSAELELVPAGKARDAGIDRSLVLGYGQDDRICAYTSAEAIFAAKPNKAAVVYLADKEEIGSEGNTGARSIFIIDFIADLLKHNGESYDSATLRKTLL
ncbi:MAG: aminopeptidase, partial [Candidatus Cloacimonetes bacterium]|nr:aminopeptidase [Candidatus Cloacimonadota bacterium]